MAHRTDDIPGVGSDLDLVNIAVGRRLSTLEDYTLRSELSKNTYRTFADGVEYAAQIYNILAARHRTAHFPLFVAVHRICQKELQPQDFIHCFQSHPIHL